MIERTATSPRCYHAPAHTVAMPRFSNKSVVTQFRVRLQYKEVPKVVSVVTCPKLQCPASVAALPIENGGGRLQLHHVVKAAIDLTSGTLYPCSIGVHPWRKTLLRQFRRLCHAPVVTDSPRSIRGRTQWAAISSSYGEFHSCREFRRSRARSGPGRRCLRSCPRSCYSRSSLR